MKCLHIAEAKKEISSELIDIYSKLGSVSLIKKDFERSEQIHIKVIELSINEYGEQHIQTAYAYETLANAYKKIGDFDKAEENYLMALDIKENFYNNCSYCILDTYKNLLDLYKDVERFSEKYKLTLQKYELLDKGLQELYSRMYQQ